MTSLQTSAQKQLRQLVEQVERLAEEHKGIAKDISDKFAEAKALGFDVKAMKKVIALRRLSKQEREEQDAILDTYMHALGLLGTPLQNWVDGQEREEQLQAAE